MATEKIGDDRVDPTSNVGERLTNTCPHCGYGFHAEYRSARLNAGARLGDDASFLFIWATCPGKACKKATVYLYRGIGPGRIEVRMVHPRNVGREPLPAEVPETFAADYKEACAVLDLSPKASAALSRRCLQLLLHEHLQIKKKDLSLEIQALLDAKTLPADIAEDVDAIRHIGNFAAHPAKSLTTGEIVEVAPGEAEWTLDVLESLFDFYFVRPAQRAGRRAAFEAKLADAKPKAEFKEPPK